MNGRIPEFDSGLVFDQHHQDDLCEPITDIRGIQGLKDFLLFTITEPFQLFKDARDIEKARSTLRRFVLLGGSSNSEPLASYSWATFDPNEHKEETVVFLDKEERRSKRFFPGKAKMIGEGQWLNESELNRRYLGVIIPDVARARNRIIYFYGMDQEIVSDVPNGVDIIDGQISLGTWDHTVRLFDQLEFISGFWPTNFDVKTDVFTRFNRVDILEVGKGMREFVLRRQVSQMPRRIPSRNST